MCNLDVLRFAAYVFTDSSKEMIWTSEEGYKYKGKYPDVYTGIELLQLFIENGDTAFPSCCLIFIKRETVELNNLRFREGIIHEDNLFHWELMSLSERTAVLNKPLYCRRLRNGSITQTPNWINKIRSMCVSAEEADAFIMFHPQIAGETSNWYFVFFINSIISSWFQMTPQMRASIHTKEYLRRAKLIAKNITSING